MNNELFKGNKVLTISEKGYYIIVDTFNVMEAYKASPTVDNMADRDIVVDDDCKSERKVRFVDQCTERDSNSSTGLSVANETSILQNENDAEIIDFSKDETNNETTIAST